MGNELTQLEVDLRMIIMEARADGHSGDIKPKAYYTDKIMQLIAAQKQRWEAEARKDEVANAKIAHIDMPKEGIKKTFDDWCFKRYEEIDDGKFQRRFE
jgi:hypothetical protein